MDILARLEQFLIESEKESYLVYAGLKDDANFSAIYDRYPGLISRETLKGIQGMLLPEDEKAELIAFLYTGIIGEELKERTDAVLTRELEETIAVDGTVYPFRQAAVLVANSKKHADRRTFEAARAATQARINPEYVELEQDGQRIATEFGYESYAKFFESVERIPLDAMRAETDRFLAETWDLYNGWKSDICKRWLDVPAAQACSFDLVHLRRAAQFDSMFPADRMTSTVWKMLDQMGIDAEKNPNIHVDIEPRAKKSPRAFCCAVRVPSEVYLVILPHGGTDDYSSFLHELGHTLHYAYTSAALPLSARYLGDNSVTEGFAGTLENLLESPTFLRDMLGIRNPTEFVQYITFIKLYLARRYCGKFQYELSLNGGKTKPEEWPGLYASTLTTVTGVTYDPTFFLQDVDSHFYCVRYLRAWMLEGQMRAALERDFGGAWFHKKGAGDFLRDVWSLGQSLNAEGVSHRIGFGALNFDGLIEECRRVREGNI